MTFAERVAAFLGLLPRAPGRVSIAGDRVAVCGESHFFDSIDHGASCPTCGNEGALVEPMLARKAAAGRRLRLVQKKEAVRA